MLLPQQPAVGVISPSRAVLGDSIPCQSSVPSREHLLGLDRRCGQLFPDAHQFVAAGERRRIERWPRGYGEFLMSVTGHAATDHNAVESVEGCEQRGDTVTLVVGRHGAALA